ncbi:MAG: PEP-CTERM sorting domain-containing protein [Phycisphaerae bacterium]
MRLFTVSMMSLALAPAALGGLAIGDVQYNPDLSGSGLVGSSGPFYTSGTPSWLDPANLLVSMSSPIMGIPGFEQFVGTVESYAYLNGNTIGLAYSIHLEPNSADRLVRASVGPEGWSGVSIFETGSDGLGSSTPTTGAVNWSDGDPHFIGRDFVTAAPYWQFRLGNIGSTLDGGQSSSLIWFETNSRQIGEVPITLQDGGAVGGARVLTIPEPASLALLVFGAGFFAIDRKRTA